MNDIACTALACDDLGLKQHSVMGCEMRAYGSCLPCCEYQSEWLEDKLRP